MTKYCYPWNPLDAIKTSHLGEMDLSFEKLKLTEPQMVKDEISASSRSSVSSPCTASQGDQSERCAGALVGKGVMLTGNNSVLTRLSTAGPSDEYEGLTDCLIQRSLDSHLVQRTKTKKHLSAQGDNPHSIKEGVLDSMLKRIYSLPQEVSPSEDLTLREGFRHLVKGLGRQGHTDRAVDLFDWLRRQGTSGEYGHLLDVFTYTTAISLCAARQQLQRALDLLEEMRLVGAKRNVHTYSALMNVAIKSNAMQLAKEIYMTMLREGIQPNLVTYNTLTDVYVRTGQWQEALRVLDMVEAQGIRAEVRTYNTIITACNKSGQPDQGLAVYHRMIAAGVAPTATTYTALISAYGKKGQVERAIEVFQDMIRRGCERNVITYSSVISACERVGRWELALDLFHKMQEEGCKPNVVTYNSLIAACAHGGHWEKAKELFDQMAIQGCKRDTLTHNAMIIAYQKGSQWRSALKAFEDMQKQGSHPDMVTYNSLLDVLWKSGIVYVQLAAAHLWGIAHRCGQFRMYSQSKMETGRLVYNCVAFTAGTAILTVVHWLVDDLRLKICEYQAAEATGLVQLAVQRGRQNRVEQPPSVIYEALSAVLVGHQAPLTIEMYDQTILIEGRGPDLATWMCSAAFAPLQCLVSGSPGGWPGSDKLIMDDLALQARCVEAFQAVRSYEDVHQYTVTSSPAACLYQNAHAVQLATQYAAALSIRMDLVYNGLQLFHRLMASPTAGAITMTNLPLVVIACIMVASRQAGTESQLSYNQVAVTTGLSVSGIMAMEQNVRSWVPNTACISPAKVACLYLERLGFYSSPYYSSALLAMEVQNVMDTVACSPCLQMTRPSVVAAGMLYWLRQGKGQEPYWPAALAGMTGYVNLTEGDLGNCLLLVKQAMDQ